MTQPASKGPTGRAEVLEAESDLSRQVELLGDARRALAAKESARKLESEAPRRLHAATELALERR